MIFTKSLVLVTDLEMKKMNKNFVYFVYFVYFVIN